MISKCICNIRVNDITWDISLIDVLLLSARPAVLYSNKRCTKIRLPYNIINFDFNLRCFFVLVEEMGVLLGNH